MDIIVLNFKWRNGTTEAPYLAVGALLQLACGSEKENPLESQKIKQDLFVDDQLTGSNSV